MDRRNKSGNTNIYTKEQIERVIEGSGLNIESQVGSEFIVFIPDVHISAGRSKMEDEEEENSEDEEAELGSGKRKSVGKTGLAKKKTLKDRNRQVRRRVEEDEIARRKKEKKQRHDLSQLKTLTKDVDETLADREERVP